MVGKGANRIRAVTFHSIQSSGFRRLSPSGWRRELRPALSRFAPSPTIKSDRSIAAELRRTSRRVVGVKFGDSSLNSANAGPLAGGVRGVPP
jgi:hypothetical protein